ncbi:MAG: hypothetical protein HZB16_02095 [Armatimonadetes bacterium]|nr:hypothetical protein [Armatimonadota bacterium]
MAKLLAGHTGSNFHRLLRILTATALVVALPGLALAFWRALSALPTRPAFALTLAGFVVGIAFGRIVLRWLPTLSIAEHEFTHLLAGLPFLCLPTKFVVRRSGGLASHRATPLPYVGPLVEDFITLAPYVCPTLSLIAAPFAGPAAGAPVMALLGVTLGYHASTTWAEMLVNWTGRRLERADRRGEIRSDIAQVGFGFSLVYIPAVSLALHGIVLAVALNGLVGLNAWAGFVARGVSGFWLGALK